MKMDTKLIHGGVLGDPHTGAVSVPIYQVSTYIQSRAGEHSGYEYSRTSNPTRDALEQTIAALENGIRGFAFASGMCAIHTIISLFRQGDHIVVGDDIYGGTFRIIDKVFSHLGITASFVDTSNIESIRNVLTPETKAVFLETPSNPLLKVSDIREVSKLCKESNLLLVVDNTFLTPYWQNPLDLGADIVVHSATKYLGGHSDLVAGLVVVREEHIAERIHFLQYSMGGILGPQDSWLLLRGMKTLGLRMKQHETNAMFLAQWLQEQGVKVYYPGLPTHPGHGIAKSQARGFGGMISFDVGNRERADQIVERVKYFILAESLGAVESLVSIPERMTHASVPPERRVELGITEGLIRISVGVEDIEDLVNDMKQALNT